MTSGTAFDKILDKEYHYFLHLKRLYLLQTKVLESCDGRPIRNDLIYHQLLFSSLDGLILRLDNFHERLIGFLNTLKNDHLDRFKRNNKNGLAVAPEAIHSFDNSDPKEQIGLARILSKEHYDHFDKVYDRLFPGVKVRNEGRPNHSDFDTIIQNLRNTFKPIRAHRDTVVAHWDKEQEPATIADLKNAVQHIELLLKDLFFTSKLGSLGFELGGVAASVSRTSKELAELIMGSHRVRKAKVEDMDTIYLMGFDVWSDNQNENDYLTGCRSSKKYAAGTWYVLEDGDGKPVSALITYELAPINGKLVIGIGSIATVPELRRKGHAGHLLWDTARLFFERNGTDVFFLHADISPAYYEKLGFVRLPDKYQLRTGSIVMVKCLRDNLAQLLADPEFQAPEYF
ncbi:MAG: GNAT family N-acetyltransferase [Deltaproteobacteria bacterium]|nr:GNAT family N-acetyltransferase [Deltaproteobacteria bacterium]